MGPTDGVAPSDDSIADGSTVDWREALRRSQEAFRPFRQRGVRLNAAELIREGRDDEEDYRNWEPDALPGR